MGVTRLLGALAFCSAGAVGYGFWLAWPPLGWIVAGLGGLAFALLYDTDRRGPE